MPPNTCTAVVTAVVPASVAWAFSNAAARDASGCALVPGERGVPEESAHRLDLGVGLGAHVLHCLIRRDDAPELLARLGVADGFFEHALGGAEGVGRERDARGVDDAIDLVGVDSRQALRGADLDVVELELADTTRLIDGRERARLEPRRAARKQQQLARRALPRHHHERVGDLGIGDEHAYCRGACPQSTAGAPVANDSSSSPVVTLSSQRLFASVALESEIASGAATAALWKENGAAARPSSYAVIAASRRPRPEPPAASGQRMPETPWAASPETIAGSCPLADSMTPRTRGIGTASFSQPRSASPKEQLIVGEPEIHDSLLLSPRSRPSWARAACRGRAPR